MSSFVPLGFLLCMFPDFDHALVVTGHAVDGLTSFGKDEFVDSVITDLAFETMSVVRIISGHNGLVKDGQTTNTTAVGAIGANGGAVR